MLLSAVSIFFCTFLIWFLIFLLLDTVLYHRLRVQVDDEHFYDGPDNLDYETDDSSGISLCQVDDEPFFYGFDVPDCENDLSNGISPCLFSSLSLI